MSEAAVIVPTCHCKKFEAHTRSFLPPIATGGGASAQSTPGTAARSKAGSADRR